MMYNVDIYIYAVSKHTTTWNLPLVVGRFDQSFSAKKKNPRERYYVERERERDLHIYYS
jgi:hypothetical protein